MRCPYTVSPGDVFIVVKLSRLMVDVEVLNAASYCSEFCWLWREGLTCACLSLWLLLLVTRPLLSPNSFFFIAFILLFYFISGGVGGIFFRSKPLIPLFFLCLLYLPYSSFLIYTSLPFFFCYASSPFIPLFLSIPLTHCFTFRHLPTCFHFFP